MPQTTRYVCTIADCKKTFASDQRRITHETSSKHCPPIHQCPQCDLRYQRLDTLKKHQRRKHGIPGKSDPMPQTSDPMRQTNDPMPQNRTLRLQCRLQSQVTDVAFAMNGPRANIALNAFSVPSASIAPHDRTQWIGTGENKNIESLARRPQMHNMLGQATFLSVYWAEFVISSE
jgi:hypothetical protein